MSFIAEYYDPGLTISKQDTPATLTRQERERLSRTLALVIHAGTIPRRLGADADAKELSADKRRAKRVAYALKQCLDAWGGMTADKFDVQSEAAQLNWTAWWTDHRILLINRMRYVSTWQAKTEGDVKWAKSAVVKLNNELRWVEYALR